MTAKRNLLWLVVSGLSFTGTAGLAEDDFGFEDDTIEDVAPYLNNRVEVGIGYTSDDNGKLGEFSPDLSEQGLFGVGALYLGGYSDNHDRLYLEAEKSPYNSDVNLGYRKEENLTVELYGRDSQKIIHFNALTLYPDSGSSTYLPIPDGLTANLEQGRRGPEWVPDYSALELYDRRTFKVERDSYGIGVTKYVNARWLIRADYDHQTKSGVKSQGNHGNDAILPIPVDYEHDEFTIGVEYKAESFSLGARYYLSDFSDRNEAVIFESFAYDGTNTPVTVTEALSTEPDSLFSRFETDGTYFVGERTVLNWLANWSVAEQDEAIIGASSPAAFDGEVKRFNGRVTLRSRPTRTFDYKVEYALRDRDASHSPMDLNPLGYSSRDSSVFSKNRETIKLQGGYRLPNRSKLRFGWRNDAIERTRDTTVDWGGLYAHATGKTDENLLWADYKFAPLGDLALSVKLETADREADENQHPEWTTPYYADRKLDRASLNAILPLNTRVVLSGGYAITEEDFDTDNWVPIEGDSVKEPYGISHRDTSSANIQLSIAPNKDLALSLYSLWQWFEWSSYSDQADPAWTYDADDDTKVYGFNINWQASAKLQLTADFVFSDAESDVVSRDGITIQQAPQATTENTRVDIELNYDYDPQTSVYLQYLYEKWNVYDWANEGTLDENVAWAWDADDGANNAFIVGVRRRF